MTDTCHICREPLPSDDYDRTPVVFRSGEVVHEACAAAPGMTIEQRALLRAAAAKMTSLEILQRYGQALHAWASALTPETAQLYHEVASEYAEIHGKIRQSR